MNKFLCIDFKMCHIFNDTQLYILFCNMNIVYTFPNFSFTEGGNYNYPGNNKVAKNPYIRLEGGFSFCELQCDNETSCNGYLIDESTNSCFLSRCNEYIIVTCSSCFFAKKKKIQKSFRVRR